MEYPREFSQQARARVEAERLRAGKQLQQDRNGVLWSPYGPGLKDEENLRKYILRVVLVFTAQACELGLQGMWTVDQVRSEVDEFLRRLTIEAYHEDGFDKTGRKLREMVSHWDGSILPEIRREFRNSAEWQQIEEALEIVAARQEGGTSVSTAGQQLTGHLPATAIPREADQSEGVVGCGNQVDRTTADWNRIEISFLSDERVQIRNGSQTETRNYAEFGFADRRNDKPNQAWRILRDLAEADGTIGDTSVTGGDWPMVEKRIQEIRKVLRRHFGIAADPIPFVEGTGYRTRFKIGCKRSFQT